MRGIRYSQHFLTNQHIAQQTVKAAHLSPTDTVLEIGPGHGILTHLLAKQAQSVIAVEIDPELVLQLQTTLPENVTIIQDNILNLDLQRLPHWTKVIANLPFHISSDITFKLLTYPFTRAVLMYQKDFADRLKAEPGSKKYGRLTVGVYYKTICRPLMEVPRDFFIPHPRVDASIVIMRPRKNPPFHVKDESFFYEVTKKLFMYRRKKIKTSVKLSYPVTTPIPFADHRVDQLTPQQIGILSDYLYTHSKR